MQYSVNALSKLTGISKRALRYYDEIGLLKPERSSTNNYRIYNTGHVDRLQQILFFRELGLELEEIGRILSAPDFNREDALTCHLIELKRKRKQVDLLIQNVEKTLASMKGETFMSDHEKFEGFKRDLVDENERRYGKEIRGKYGDDTVDKSNEKLLGMTREQYDDLEILTQELNNALKEACAAGDPASERAQEACRLHKKWLSFYQPDNTFSPEYHMSLGQMYADDDRFAQYYEKIAPGCAVFLRDALMIFYSKAGEG